MGKNDYKKTDNIQIEKSPYISIKEKMVSSYMNDTYDQSISNNVNDSVTLAKEIILEQMRQAEKELHHKLVRPNVKLFPGILYLGIYVLLSIMGVTLSDHLAIIMNLGKKVIVIAILLFDCLIIFLFFKKFLIWIIEIYQKYAPSNVRLSCRFEPTCSQYMKLAVYKYGVVLGMIKGLKRLSKCHPPNGGVDYP